MIPHQLLPHLNCHLSPMAHPVVVFKCFFLHQLYIPCYIWTGIGLAKYRRKAWPFDMCCSCFKLLKGGSPVSILLHRPTNIMRFTWQKGWLPPTKRRSRGLNRWLVIKWGVSAASAVGEKSGDSLLSHKTQLQGLFSLFSCSKADGVAHPHNVAEFGLISQWTPQHCTGKIVLCNRNVWVLAHIPLFQVAYTNIFAFFIMLEILQLLNKCLGLGG